MEIAWEVWEALETGGYYRRRSAQASGGSPD
jgi:hypothetical protein